MNRLFFAYLSNISWFLIPHLGATQLASNMQAQEIKKGQIEAKQEAEIMSKQGHTAIAKALDTLYHEEGALKAFQNHFLVEKETIKRFDPQTATKQIQAHDFSKQPELQLFVTQSWKTREDKEETSAYVQHIKHQTKNPHEVIGVESYQTSLIPEEIHLQTCQEKGTYVKTIFQTLRVHIDAITGEKRKVCKGHAEWVSAKYPTRGSAKTKKTSLKKALNQHPNARLVQIKITEGAWLIGEWGVEYRWKHIDPNRGGFMRRQERPWEQRCTSYNEEIVTQERQRDEWITPYQDLHALKDLSKRCALIQTNDYNPGENFATNGKKVWKPAWGKRLVFSCAPEENSPCEKLRQQGGIMVNKECLDSDEEGNCRLFEKIYEMGGSKGAYTEQAFQFASSHGQEERLFGLEEFDRSYEKNTSFGQVFATYSALADLESQPLNHATPSIFAGKPSTCRRCFSSKKVFDCCYRQAQGRGFLIETQLATCSDGEKTLFDQVGDKKCHKVGSYRDGFIEKRVYCCFPTLIARIVQEEGRAQLGLSWGTPRQPLCAGFTFNRFQQLDFEQMDFSDFTESFQRTLSVSSITQKLNELTEKFSNPNALFNAKDKTHALLEKQREKVRLEKEKSDAP